MLLPSSFETAYWEQRANAEAVQVVADSVLRIEVCGNDHGDTDDHRGWLFAARVKAPESALARLEVGPVKSLKKMRDLYAATVVVPTRREIPEAVAAVEAAFPGARLQNRRVGDADTFIYDDVHVLATLGDRVSVTQPGIADLTFEVQVRTGLQFAWWRATHDVLYKGQPGSWQLRRVAAQARAALELLDTTLADLTATASLTDSPNDERDADAERRAKWVDTWSEPQRPANRVRFAESTATLLDAAGVGLEDAERLLRSDRGQALRATIEITPVQVVLALLVETCGIDWMKSLPGPVRVLVTTELEEAAPAAADIENRHRARLS